jgi:DNA-binding response OmpR family regulator
MQGYSRSGTEEHSVTSTPQMTTSSTILLVDDDETVRKVLTFPLERDGYEVLQAADGEEALKRFGESPVDLVVLDIMLPRLDGLDVCKAMRAQSSSVPIIMLTARDDELDKVLGLELGADDYITKPFSIREFRSRVRALLRRARAPRHEPSEDAEQTIEIGDLVIDLTRRTVALAGEKVQLTYVEFELLAILAGHPGRVYTRRMLLETLWGSADFRDPRTIDVHVRHLREKLELDSRDPVYILTVRSVGYRFRDR